MKSKLKGRLEKERKKQILIYAEQRKQNEKVKEMIYSSKVKLFFSSLVLELEHSHLFFFRSLRMAGSVSFLVYFFLYLLFESNIIPVIAASKAWLIPSEDCSRRRYVNNHDSHVIMRVHLNAILNLRCDS